MKSEEVVSFLKKYDPKNMEKLTAIIRCCFQKDKMFLMISKEKWKQ